LNEAQSNEARRENVMKFLRFALIGAAALLAACSNSDNAVDTSASSGAGGVPAANTVEYFNLVVGDRVFFATDSSSISPDAQATLIKQAQWLTTYPETTVTIEGHTDERGTREYNLALGARRANSVKAFLIGQGVAANRMRPVSYGKERPTALCSNESCWSQNRRGVTVIAGAPTS